jgi:ubiquinol-cytochrome c reductase cytochrome c1 subunit
MHKKTTIIGALLAAMLFAGAQPAVAAEAVVIDKQPWSFSGVFGTFDKDQLQRGFQVFREVCSSCHSARLLAFRNLSEKGGPEYSEEQVKALAAEYEIADPTAEGGVRPGIAADRWPSPFANDQEARDANGGVVPPDFSVIANARGTTQPFPYWLLNYVTPYQEGGPDYIYALLTGYEEEVPEGVEIPEGKYYNHVFPGHAIGMAPPLADDSVTYGTGENGETLAATLDQEARDVSAFLMWLSEPHMVARKETGLQVILFLILFAGLMYAVKQRLWAKIEH